MAPTRPLILNKCNSPTWPPVRHISWPTRVSIHDNTLLQWHIYVKLLKPQFLFLFVFFLFVFFFKRPRTQLVFRVYIDFCTKRLSNSHAQGLLPAESFSLMSKATYLIALPWSWTPFFRHYSHAFHMAMNNKSGGARTHARALYFARTKISETSAKHIFIKMFRDVGMIEPKSRETSAVDKQQHRGWGHATTITCVTQYAATQGMRACNNNNTRNPSLHPLLFGKWIGWA